MSTNTVYNINKVKMEIHWEKNLIINNRELNYKGVFRPDDIFSTINRALEKKEYIKRQKKFEEMVAIEGKKIYIELRPYKERTNYVRYMIKITINLDNVKEIIESVNGEKIKFNNGTINIIFDSWILGDYQNRWTLKPWVYFVKGLINKYIYKFPLEGNFPNELASDTAYIYLQIKKLLDSYKHEAGAIVKEEDVREKVALDVKKEVTDNIGKSLDEWNT